MGQVAYLGLCLLACFILGSSSTPVEGPFAKGEMPPPEKSEQSKENKIPAAAANVANTSQVNPRASCPPWAYQLRRNCYEYFAQPLPWYSAEFRCQKLRPGGHLVSYSSSNEEKMVSTFINSHDSRTDNVWTGFNAVRDYNILTWEWSDGSPYSSGAPLWDNRVPSRTLSSLECLLLINVRYPSNPSRWIQQNCDYSYPYLCKYKVDN